MKKCPKCKTDKSTEEFYKDKRRNDGLTAWCKVCYREKCAAWHSKNPARVAARNVRTLLLRKYNMTIEDYDALFVTQGGRCSICGVNENAGYGRFAIDHNHATGKVRGLLCNKCNTGIGMFMDNEVIIESALKYLVAHRVADNDR